MGKNKLKRWAEMENFDHVIQPRIDFHSPDYALKGRWHETVFGNSHPLVLELGCGKGEYTVQLAQRYPQKNFVGVDIKGARMWRGAKTARELGLANVAFLRTRIEFIDKFFGPDEVSEIWVTFPDPQPRGSKENRRLTSAWFLERFRIILQPGGCIHLKTDHRDLFLFTRRAFLKHGGTMLTETDDLYGGGSDHPDTAIQTAYEAVFRKQGQRICYLSCRFD